MEFNEVNHWLLIVYQFYSQSKDHFETNSFIKPFPIKKGL